MSGVLNKDVPATGQKKQEAIGKKEL